MKPTKQQEAIIDYKGNAVVIASPGSGKTFVISERIRKHLGEINEYQGVIAISYTNKSSAELERRCLINGLSPKNSFFGTIDKFFISEIIIPFGKHVIGLPKEKTSVVKLANAEYDLQNDLSWYSKEFKYVSLKDYQISHLASAFLCGIVVLETVGILAEYIFEKSKACKNYLLSRYKYIYIDEYQDSGHSQNNIFLAIQKLGICAVAVGDLNQSIYEFSGKDSKYLKELSQNSTFARFDLSKNHRCHESIINYSNYLLDHRTNLIESNENFVHFFRIQGNEISIAHWIDGNLSSIINKYGVSKFSQVAILCKSNRTCELINGAMSSPHRYIVSTDLDHDVNTWSLIFSSLLHYFFGKQKLFIDVVEEFTSYDRIKKEILKSLLNSKYNLEQLRRSDEIEISKLIHEFTSVAQIIAPNAGNNDSVKLLSDVLDDSEQINSYKQINDNEICILTLHKSKGLEFELAINVDLYEWVFPRKEPGPGKNFKKPIYSNYMQDLNLHYVGITRAKNGVMLISSTKRTNSDGIEKSGVDSEFIWLNDIEKLRKSPNRRCS